MFSNRSDRRSIIAIAVASLTVSVGAAAYRTASAASIAVGGLQVSATALRPAVRLSQSGVVTFPMNPTPRCAMSRTSFGQLRPDGRTHQGLDIMAAVGQEIYAVGNGVLFQQTIDGAANATLSGNSWRLRLPDGTYYFYGHLSTFAPGLAQGDTVVLGQLIGYVGDTGNPGGGNYHLHFEMHPKGGAAVDPLPLLTIPKVCKVVA